MPQNTIYAIVPFDGKYKNLYLKIVYNRHITLCKLSLFRIYNLENLYKIHDV